MSVGTKERVTNREFLQLAGISPADLHNWVARGLLPGYCGRFIEGGHGSVYYYPAWAVDRARDIKRLRDQGISGQEIRKILAGEKVGL
jgi:DNA-binding transcriptional MerR regulator